MVAIIKKGYSPKPIPRPEIHSHGYAYKIQQGTQGVQGIQGAQGIQGPQGVQKVLQQLDEEFEQNVLKILDKHGVVRNGTSLFLSEPEYANEEITQEIKTFTLDEVIKIINELPVEHPIQVSSAIFEPKDLIDKKVLIEKLTLWFQSKE